MDRYVMDQNNELVLWRALFHAQVRTRRGYKWYIQWSLVVLGLNMTRRTILWITKSTNTKFLDLVL